LAKWHGIILGLLLCQFSAAQPLDGGHFRLNNTHSLESANHTPLNFDGRLNFKGGDQHWQWQLDVAGEANTWCEYDCDNDAIIDRANVRFSLDNFNITAGRHAISWGNGLIFNPVDVFNPFDPLAINRDYKPGDDLIHVEQTLDNGDNLQYLWVNHDSEYSLSTKYHGFSNDLEYDVLIASHYGNSMFSLGLSLPLGDWLWRGDYQYQHLESGERAHSVVTNVQRFFELASKPSSFTLEWYHNGFGLQNNSSPAEFEQWLKRLNRGEIFTPGRDYLALALTTQMTTLWNVGITSISEAQNDQHILQIISHHSLASDVELTLALNLPWGRDHWAKRLNTQASERSLSAQLSWYF